MRNVNPQCSDGIAAVLLGSPPKTMVVRSMPRCWKARPDIRTSGGSSPSRAASHGGAIGKTM